MKRRSSFKITRKNKRITITALVIFLLIAVAAALGSLVVGMIGASARAERDAIIEPLERERARLRRELASLETDLTALLPNGSTITPVATELDAKLYDVVFEIFEGKAPEQPEDTLKLVGTMCLSPKELPGEEGQITMDQYYEMLAAGWSTALRVSKKEAESFDEYYSTMSGILAEIGIAMPDTVYFESGAYSFSLDDKLISLGFKNVFHHREHGLPQIGNDPGDALWRVGSISWNSGETRPAFNRLVASSGNLAITFAFSQTVKEDFFPPDIYGAYYSFNKMLSMFRMYISEGKLESAAASVGRENYTEYSQMYNDMLNIMDARRLVLEEQIAQLDAQIFDIYSKHGELD